MIFLNLFEILFLLLISYILLNSIYLSVTFSNLISFLGFCFPENYFLFDVILLYIEIFNIGIIILFILLYTLSIILTNFNYHLENPYVVCFTSFDGSLFLKDLSTIVNNSTLIKSLTDYDDYYNPPYLYDPGLPPYALREIIMNEIVSNNQNNYTSLEFDPQTEEFFDFIFVLIPSIFILMILIPCVGYLYTGEFFFNWLLYDVKLDLIGYQWYWYYEFKVDILYSVDIYETNGYLTKYCDFTTVLNYEEDVFKRNLDTDGNMVLPQNINVLISISSGDVIHSYTIPGYTTKFDAIPGRTYCFINPISDVGYNWGQCSELCGTNHAFMPSSLDVNTDRYSFDFAVETYYIKSSNY